MVAEVHKLVAPVEISIALVAVTMTRVLVELVL
jgi:hypothetical protein